MRYKNDISRSATPILGLLTWRPMAGYELKSEIEGSLQNFWSESFGQLYPQLSKLHEAGLIQDEPDASTDGRGKRVYSITEQGRAALKTWLSEEPTSRPPRNELLMKVFFAMEGDIAAVIDHCRQAETDAKKTLKRYREIEQRLIGMLPERRKARFWLMTVRFGITQTESLIAWCGAAVLELQSLMETDDETTTGNRHAGR